MPVVFTLLQAVGEPTSNLSSISPYQYLFLVVHEQLGNIRGMYEGIKKAVGPIQSKTAPLKSSSGEVITDKGQQMERWVEHYSQLYSRDNVVVTSALDAIEPLPIMEELDAERTLGEISKAIDSLTFGKAPGIDGIPPDLIKRCKTTLLQPLRDLL